jgi:hypothetical protein
MIFQTIKSFLIRTGQVMRSYPGHDSRDYDDDCPVCYAERQVKTLQAHIADAIDILDNDKYATRAINARAILADALDDVGWPDEHGPDD